MTTQSHKAPKHAAKKRQGSLAWLFVPCALRIQLDLKFLLDILRNNMTIKQMNDAMAVFSIGR